MIMSMMRRRPSLTFCFNCAVLVANAMACVIQGLTLKGMRMFLDSFTVVNGQCDLCFYVSTLHDV
eukprot:6198253-Pleurochrysis_carterae.AAC.1